MSLFKDIADIRAIIPRIASSYTWGDLAPFIDLAEKKYITEAISEEFFEELNTAYAGTPSSEESAAIARLKYPIAYYALLEALPSLGMQIGNAGIGIGTSQTTAQPTQWQQNKLENSLASNAETFLDAALEFLETHKADYSTFATSSAYTESKVVFMINARALNAFLPIFNSRRAYQQLRPFMLDAQETTISTVIGAELYEDLLTKLAADTLNADELALIKLINKPLAHLTARLAFNQLAIAYQGAGFRILSSNDGIIQKQALAPDKLSPLLNDFATRAEVSLNTLKKYLQANADAWPLYKESTAYIPDTSTQPSKMPNNCGHKSFIV